MIHLDYRDTRPIYEQVVDGLRRLMVTGVLAPGDKLPSVRQLATQLTINPNTIARAYSALEAEGFVFSVSGRGTFVAEGREQHRGRIRELQERLRPILRELKELGMTEEELRTLWKGGNDHAGSEERRQDL
jgi:GntR family transcriptional regulator